jgi:hypothetical protein
VFSDMTGPHVGVAVKLCPQKPLGLWKDRGRI